MRRIIAIILILIILVAGFVFWRSTRQVIADKDGNPIRYNYEEIDDKGLTGVFVHNADGTFSPAIHSMPNFQGETDEKSADRFIWYVETDKSIGDYIPVLTEKDELVVIYNVDGDLPGSYYLEQYGLKGYSIGAHIRLGEDKTMFLSAEEPLPGSQASGVLQNMEANTDDEYTISKISGSDVLPINNVDPHMNLLLGLEKDKLYKLQYYQGTKVRQATFRADAKVFQSERYIPIATPYRKTDNGYFIVNLPMNLSNGFYYLSDIGFFEVKRRIDTDAKQ